jgi:hypothetical protein
VIAGVWVGDAFSRLSEVAWARIEPLMPQAERAVRPVADVLGGRYRPTQRATASRGNCPSTADEKWGGEHPLTLHSEYRAHQGACGKTRVLPHTRRPKRQYWRNGRHEMRGLLSTYGSRGGRRTDGGTRGAVAGIRRGGAGVCAARFAELLARVAVPLGRDGR